MMQKFWNQLTDEDLEALIPRELPFSGTASIQTRFQEKTRRRSLHGLRRLLILAAVLSALCLGGYAYYRWQMPAPSSITGNAVQITQEHTYTEAPDSASALKPEEVVTETGFTDQDFLNKAQKVLAILGTEADQTLMTVTHQTDQRWQREQAVVTFPRMGKAVSISFDTADGTLLEIHDWTSELDGSGLPIMSDADALAAAEGWYHRLPYPQGYVYSDVNKIDDGAWMYSFTREITVEIDGQPTVLRNAYEEVRLAIDPRSGAFLVSNCFHVPLLDDHHPEDVPLSVEAARAVIEDHIGSADDVSARLVICHPAHLLAADHAHISVTRLAWEFECYYAGGEDAIDSWSLYCVDLYTGELLRMDAT